MEPGTKAAPPTRQPQTIHSFARGLSVLVALNENSPITLAHLVEITGLPKATTMRIVHTLRAEGYVELVQNGYRPLPRVRLLSSALDRESAPTQFVQRLLNDFAQIVKWPAEFLLRDGASMAIEVTNRNVAPIGLKKFEYTRFPLLNSAAGIALLAWAKPHEREQIIRTVSTQLKLGSTEETMRSARTEMEGARKRRYAQHDYEAPIEGTRAISVPALWKDTSIGAVSLIFIRDAVTPEQLKTFLLPQLWLIATEIGQHFSILGGLVNEIKQQHP
ncbi:MAG: helix-turn-helix domain-containing protein [Pseudolabrys sp.]|nr:helix-turn-helix domain-containing protein [Pseudolabrys sp.]